MAGSGDEVAVRNSWWPQGAVLQFAAPEMADFLASIKAGELDDLA